MGNYLIVDAHVHTYPNAAAGEQAMQGTGRSGCSGTIEELISVMSKSGISYAVMANMTPTYDMKTAALGKLPPAIADEERKHVGELQQLLYMISPKEAEHTEKGRQKVQQQQAQNFQAPLQ